MLVRHSCQFEDHHLVPLGDPLLSDENTALASELAREKLHALDDWGVTGLTAVASMVVLFCFFLISCDVFIDSSVFGFVLCWFWVGLGCFGLVFTCVWFLASQWWFAARSEFQDGRSLQMALDGIEEATFGYVWQK